MHTFINRLKLNNKIFLKFQSNYSQCCTFDYERKTRTHISFSLKRACARSFSTNQMPACNSSNGNTSSNEKSPSNRTVCSFVFLLKQQQLKRVFLHFKAKPYVYVEVIIERRFDAAKQKRKNNKTVTCFERLTTAQQRRKSILCTVAALTRLELS